MDVWPLINTLFAVSSNRCCKEIRGFQETVTPIVIRTRFQNNEHFLSWKEAAQNRTDMDRFCSSPFWGIPLNDAFQGASPIFVYQNGDRDLGIFIERKVRGGVLVMPVDGMWLLGTPLLSAQPTRLFQSLATYWAAHPLSEGVRQIMFSGIYPSSPLCDPRLWERLNGWEIDPSGRMVASLKGGLDGFMSRRSKNFRSRLRRTVKAAKRDGIRVEFMSNAPDTRSLSSLLERVFDLEGQSWKGQSKRGIDSGGMRRFYEIMVPLLASEGRLRGLFLVRDGRDLAYLFGGFFDGYFRGLQFSYLHDVKLGLGNVCQYHMIRRLVEEGCQEYDLGQAMEYKARWAENHIESKTFVFQL